MTTIYKQCPKCRAKHAVPILFGAPPKSYERESADKFIPGSCYIKRQNPAYHCPHCQHEWHKEQTVNSAYADIKGLRVSVANEFETLCDVEINFSTSQVFGIYRVQGTQEMIQKTIRSTDIKQFIDELARANLLNWRANYVDAPAVKGLDWTIEIITARRKKKKCGANKFPAQWNAFCEAVSQITEKPHVLPFQLSDFSK